VVLEKTNARYLSETHVGTLVDMIVCDASFIGLETLLPEPLKLAAPGCRLIALIKPQFEVGRENLPRGGVVRDPALHESACRRISAWLGALPGWRVIGVTPSPLLGPKGNREFLIAARHA
jgi:23S rRNA (cytidine1920-2'-O)/16S rRNA (cytidine1409-2'-O)-methyltransferase